jgi:F420-non-reducing hydrogenase large subunit
MSKNTREITISPTTRIEGHGKVTITLDAEGNVDDAYFYATEIRGFDVFLRGMEAARLPFIISRICGVCSTAHIVASVKAIENAYQTQITETAEKLRELLLMAQIVNNHALAFFFLTLPDFYYSIEEDPRKRNVFQIMREKPEIGKKAITLRNISARIFEVIGKREVHVVSVIPGGLISPLKMQERENLLRLSENACTIAHEAVALGKELFEKNWHDFRKAGTCETHYMALTQDSAMEFYDGNIRVINPDGTIQTEFTPEEFMRHVQEKTSPWTYAKFAYLRSEKAEKTVFQVGPTARMNTNTKATTEDANKELQEFKQRFGSPAHTTLLLDYARMIDLLYACERTRQLLEDRTITRTDTRVRISPRSGSGIGVVEAPRGTLIHKYAFTQSGLLKTMKLVIPTQINNAAINLNVKDAAAQFIHRGEIKPGLLNRIEMIVRAYDPCIKCATRQANNSLKIEIIDHRGELIFI